MEVMLGVCVSYGWWLAAAARDGNKWWWQ